MVTLPIYLDHHATTRVDPRVLAGMVPWFSEDYGNPASTNHAFGRRAAEAVELARGQVAALLEAQPREILFTSGATESNNLALKGVAAAYRQRGNHFISVVTEHPAVLDPLQRLQRQGAEVTLLPVDPHGAVSLAAVEAALTEKTVLVSVMLANNEIGTLQPLAEIGQLCKRRGVLLHTDATQAVGKLPVSVKDLQVDLLSLSAHKLYGPKGVGALFVRRREPRVRLEPLLDGGGQEHHLRSGTLNVPGIVGLGLACALAQQEMAAEARRVAALRDRLWLGLAANVPRIHLNGPPLAHRLPGNLNVSFDWVQGEALLLNLKDLAVSSGSACTTQSQQPSHVLRAIGLPDDRADASLRFGLGRWNTEEEIDWTIDCVAKAVAKLRQLSPGWLQENSPVQKLPTAVESLCTSG